MALVRCRECKARISDQAKECPKCGAPVTAPASALDGNKSPAKTSKLKSAALALLVLFGLGALGSAFNRQPSGSDASGGQGTAGASACSTDWKKCSDNHDLVEHWHDYSKVQFECKYQAEKQAAYGTPKWPFYAFGSYVSGDDYVKSGLVVAIEPDAQFQNGFGAMAHSTVKCLYDLSSDTLKLVTITPND